MGGCVVILVRVLATGVSWPLMGPDVFALAKTISQEDNSSVCHIDIQ